MTSSNLTKVRRHPERGSYDRELLFNILENGLVCQVAFQVEGQPFVIPMSYYNDQEYIYIHGSQVARITDTLRTGMQIAISILELDGLVVAKGLADNSMNYRSAIIYGKPEEVSTDEGKLEYFEEWIDHLMPGRRKDTAMPNEDELRGVAAFRVKLEQFSVKVRKGGPSEARKNPEIWSGVIPISSRFHSPTFVSSPNTPECVASFIRNKNNEQVSL